MPVLRREGAYVLRYLVTWTIRWAIRALCRVDAKALRSVPRRGPVIIVTNHINFLEVPLIYAFLFPRRTVGLVKRETWKNPALGFLAELWEAIPLERGRSDVEALEKSIGVLKRRGILAIAPEGTRSGDGRLRKGRPGIVTIAAASGASIVPIAHWGGERFWRNLRSFRRTRITLRAGESFRIEGDIAGMTHERRAELTDVVMNRLSALMPPRYRGAYPDPERALAGTALAGTARAGTALAGTALAGTALAGDAEREARP